MSGFNDEGELDVASLRGVRVDFLSDMVQM